MSPVNKKKGIKMKINMCLFFDGTACSYFNADSDLPQLNQVNKPRVNLNENMKENIEKDTEVNNHSEINDFNLNVIDKKFLRQNIARLNKNNTLIKNGIHLGLSYTFGITNPALLYFANKNNGEDAYVNGDTLVYSHYIEGVGASKGEPDDLYSEATALDAPFSNKGIIGRTDVAMKNVVDSIKDVSEKRDPNSITEIIFDLYGFSRGSACARHFSNRLYKTDKVLQEAIAQYLNKNPTKIKITVRFIGLYDTVAAVISTLTGDAHDGNTGDIDIKIRPNYVQKITHLTANDEVRYNFSLNEIFKRDELTQHHYQNGNNYNYITLPIPGTHLDIGGGYPRDQVEHIHISPVYNYLNLDFIGKSQAVKKAQSCIDLFKSRKTWDYASKAEFAYTKVDVTENLLGGSVVALSHRNVKAGLSNVTLKLMMEAAERAGITFPSKDQILNQYSIKDDLIDTYQKLSDKVIGLEKGIDIDLNLPEENIKYLAENYIHASASYSEFSVEIKDKGSNTKRLIHSSELTNLPEAAVNSIIDDATKIIYIYRPTDNYIRGIYDYDAVQIQG